MLCPGVPAVRAGWAGVRTGLADSMGNSVEVVISLKNEY